MHEINNPINYIVTGLSVLEACCDDHETLGDMRDGLERVQEIIAAVRSFAYQAETQCQPCRVHSLFATTRRLLAAELISIDLAESATDLVVEANANQLVQVLVNLVQNAIHAVADNPPDRPGHIALFTLDHRVCVRDNGCGIPAEITPRVFDPFFTTKPPGEGTGLGLSIAHSIMQQHGGTIYVDSQLGDTCFTLDFST